MEFNMPDFSLPKIDSPAEQAARYIAEGSEFFGKRLERHNAKGESQLWFRAIVEGGDGVGPVSIQQVGIRGGQFLVLNGTNQNKDTVEMLLHVSQLRVSFVTIPLEKSTDKRPIGFNAHQEPAP